MVHSPSAHTQPGSAEIGSRPVERRVRTVFYAPTRRRHYLTLKGAAFAEAGALIAAKYPTEQPEYHEGRLTYRGFHHTSDERLVRVRARLARRIAKAITAVEGPSVGTSNASEPNTPANGDSQ